jgi:hypothetical protein
MNMITRTAVFNPPEGHGPHPRSVRRRPLRHHLPHHHGPVRHRLGEVPGSWSANMDLHPSRGAADHSLLMSARHVSARDGLR